MNADALGALGAFALGIAAALHPCPFATNLAAVTLISGWGQPPRRTVAAGLGLALGVAAVHALLGALVLRGVLALPAFAAGAAFYAARLFGPFMVLAGMFMTGLLEFRSGRLAARLLEVFARRPGWGPVSGFLLGAGLGLAFCPATAGLFFGVLLPWAAGHPGELLWPACYGAGAGLVLFVSVLLLTLGLRWGAFLAREPRSEAPAVVIGTGLIVYGIAYALRHTFQVW